MQPAIAERSDDDRPMAAPFPSLDKETRSHVPTEAAAHHLSRKPQTLRGWASRDEVIRPVRVNGRLAWPVAEIRRLLGVSK